VGILLPNSIKYVVAYFSVLMLNDVVVPIYYQSTGDEIESITGVNVLDKC
jgi:acyl-CoA synthetase (AMP-forming)/AMP-acid ligase II